MSKSKIIIIIILILIVVLFIISVAVRKGNGGSKQETPAWTEFLDKFGAIDLDDISGPESGSTRLDKKNKKFILAKNKSVTFKIKKSDRESRKMKLTLGQNAKEIKVRFKPNPGNDKAVSFEKVLEKNEEEILKLQFFEPGGTLKLECIETTPENADSAQLNIK